MTLCVSAPWWQEGVIKRMEVEVRVGKAAGKDEVTGEMIKGGCDMVVDWI